MALSTDTPLVQPEAHKQITPEANIQAHIHAAIQAHIQAHMHAAIRKNGREGLVFSVIGRMGHLVINNATHVCTLPCVFGFFG